MPVFKATLFRHSYHDCNLVKINSRGQTMCIVRWYLNTGTCLSIVHRLLNRSCSPGILTEVKE